MEKNMQHGLCHKHIREFAIIILVIIVTNLSACSSAKTSTDSTTNAENVGITIFDKNEDYEVNYMPKEKILLNKIIGNSNYENVAVISRSGKVEIISAQMYLDTDGSVTSVDGNKTINDVKGIYLDDNFYSIKDAYYDAVDYLNNNEKTMVVLLDGFSLSQYKAAKEKGYVPLLSQYFQNEALSVVTPVTNAGYAAIITGKTPDINGIHDRTMREMNVDSIFDYALKNNKKSILLESDIKILNTEIEPTLHTDENKDGDTDDEMYQSSLKVVKEDYDFIFIHFHGIDDRGHSYGPQAAETMEYIKLVDNYIKELSDAWDGTIILTADHGMHKTEDGGSHGECKNSDMVVPYFIKH